MQRPSAPHVLWHLCRCGGFLALVRLRNRPECRSDLHSPLSLVLVLRGLCLRKSSRWGSRLLPRGLCGLLQCRPKLLYPLLRLGLRLLHRLRPQAEGILEDCPGLCALGSRMRRSLPLLSPAFRLLKLLNKNKGFLPGQLPLVPDVRTLWLWRRAVCRDWRKISSRGKSQGKVPLVYLFRGRLFGRTAQESVDVGHDVCGQRHSSEGGFLGRVPRRF